jgi:hypothetical protein
MCVCPSLRDMQERSVYCTSLGDDEPGKRDLGN